MKQNMIFRGMGVLLGGMTKKHLADKSLCRQIKAEYRAILDRADDIGSSNRLNSSYGLAAWFIAMNRADGLTPEENLQILDAEMRKSSLLRAFMGDRKSYFSEKAMAGRRDWSRETHDPAHRKQYPNDWIVDVVEDAPGYRFGFNYRECGVCKLCRDEGCPEWAKYLCRLDFMLVEIIGIHLDRTMTLAEGGEYCDFRFRD